MVRLYDLYIINRDGLCLLHQKFGATEVDSDLVGGFFSAIQQFMRDVLPIGNTQTMKSLDRGDFKLLIEHGREADIFGVAISEKEDVEIRRKLIDIITEFETNYKDRLFDFDGNVEEFQEFKNYILSKFPSQLIPLELPKFFIPRLPAKEVIEEVMTVKTKEHGSATIQIDLSYRDESGVPRSTSLDSTIQIIEVQAKIRSEELEPPSLEIQISTPEIIFGGEYTRIYFDIINKGKCPAKKVSILINGQFTGPENEKRIRVIEKEFIIRTHPSDGTTATLKAPLFDASENARSTSRKLTL